MKCPSCATVDLSMADRLGISIDFCPKCRGVWLDRDELDKIIERSLEHAPARERAAAPPPPAQPQQHPQHQGYYGHRDSSGRLKAQGYRRKSWLSELFD